jgi:hypothetical protein
MTYADAIYDYLRSNAGQDSERDCRSRMHHSAGPR